MKKIYYHLGVLAIVLLVLCGCTSCQNSSSASRIGNQSALTGEDAGIMEVHFIDVGQGDCTLITCEGHAMLIDAGNNSKGTAVQMYLTKQGIHELDYVIGTHPDADHIGGLDVILYKFVCKNVLLPDYRKDTKTYDEVIQTISQKNEKITKPVIGNTYELGSASFTVIAPVKEDYDNANDFSIGILLMHGEKRFVFTGDAEEESEKDMLANGIDISADVYKAAHHGSKTASCAEFLDTMNPGYAVISCEEGNSYGHPHAKTLNAFRKRGIQVFRTDEQGSIIARSDGKSITWNCSPSESWKAGEAIGSSAKDNGSTYQAADTGKITYIINTKTKKFHLPDCSSVEDMGRKNKVESTSSKKDLMKKGYAPCQRCLNE